MGIVLSTVLGASTPNILAAFTVLAALHLYSNYRSLLYVGLPTLNHQRAELVVMDYFHKVQDTISDPFAPAASAEPVHLLRPNDLTRVEVFVRPYVSPFCSSSAFRIGSKLPELAQNVGELRTLLSIFKHEQYLLQVRPGQFNKPHISLVFQREAQTKDLIAGYLHAARLRFEIGRGTSAGAMRWDAQTLHVELLRTLEWTRSHTAPFIASLSASGWNTENVFLEATKRRFHVNENCAP